MFLTEKQLAVLNFVRDYIEDKGVSPTLDEMSQFFGVSKITIYEHVNALEKKGAIRKTPNMARSITLVEDEVTGSSQLAVKGRIAAGAAIEAIEDTETFTLDDLASADDGCFLLRVEGESMINDHICPGDLVVIKPTTSARDGDIVVAMLDDEDTGGKRSTLKRFYREHDHIRLQPANDAMEPILVSHVEVTGKLIGVIRTRI